MFTLECPPAKALLANTRLAAEANRIFFISFSQLLSLKFCPTIQHFSSRLQVKVNNKFHFIEYFFFFSKFGLLWHCFFSFMSELFENFGGFADSNLC
jgi:hypothetical protein